MIQSANIRNFLSHENSKLEFVSGVNVIVGETKAGKSAIMEAIEWVKDNRPIGNDIRSNWGGTTSVSLNLDDHRIQRIKSDKLNQYRLDSMEPFRSIKTDVPDEIQKALNLSGINVETQFEPHFLLFSSPGEVAQHFNKIAHLEQISVAEKRVKSWISKIDSDIDSNEANKKRLEANLIEFEYLDEVEEKLQNLEEKEDLLTNLESDIESIDELIDEIESVQTEIEEQSQIIKAEKKVDELIKLVTDRDNFQDDIDSMDDLIENIETVNQEIEEHNEIIKVEEKVNELIELTKKRAELVNEIEAVDWYIEAIEDCQKEIDENSQIISAGKRVNELIDLIEQKEELQTEINDMSSLIGSIEVVTKDKERNEKQLKELQNKWNEFTGDVCPLCQGSGKIEKL